MFPTTLEINLVNEAINKKLVRDKIWQKAKITKICIFKGKSSSTFLSEQIWYKQITRKVQHFFGGISVQLRVDSPRKMKMNSQKIGEGAL